MILCLPHGHWKVKGKPGLFCKREQSNGAKSQSLGPVTSISADLSDLHSHDSACPEFEEDIIVLQAIAACGLNRTLVTLLNFAAVSN